MNYAERLKAALVAQHKNWFDYKAEGINAQYAEHISCPVCDSPEHSLYFKKDMFTFEKCKHCSMVFLSPRLNVPATYAFYNSEWTAIYNETKFNGDASSSAADDRINAANLELLRRHGGHGAGHRLLELGFGGGYFLRSAKNAGYDVYGLDVDTSNYDRARKEFPDRVFNTDLFDANFSSDTFDVVYMRDVFEHVPNPKPLLYELNRISREGALVFIEVPNIEGLIYKAVRERHICIFGFAHLNYWSPRTVGHVLNLTGYEVVDIQHESLDFTLAEIARYFLTPAFTNVHDKEEGPVVRLMMRALRKLLGIQAVSRLDRALLPRMADSMKRGSVIRVIARKRTASTGI